MGAKIRFEIIVIWALVTLLQNKRRMIAKHPTPDVQVLGFGKVGMTACDPKQTAVSTLVNAFTRINWGGYLDSDKINRWLTLGANIGVRWHCGKHSFTGTHLARKNQTLVEERSQAEAQYGPVPK